MTGVRTSVSPVNTMAAHFAKINQRLASLERSASTGPPLARIIQLEADVAALRAIVDSLNLPPP